MRSMRFRRATMAQSVPAMTTPRFSQDILATLDKSQSLRIRAGNGKHRFIGIWVVVVNGRVFVRSWSLKPQGWYRTFLEEPRGSVQIAKREIPVRAVRTRSESIKDAVDRAYLKKYNTTWMIKYAKDLVRPKSRDATIELVPLSANR
jgi:hypothetical protein